MRRGCRKQFARQPKKCDGWKSAEVGVPERRDMKELQDFIDGELDAETLAILATFDDED